MPVDIAKASQNHALFAEIGRAFDVGAQLFFCNIAVKIALSYPPRRLFFIASARPHAQGEVATEGGIPRSSRPVSQGKTWGHRVGFGD
jgi:hypothetical protein